MPSDWFQLLRAPEFRFGDFLFSWGLGIGILGFMAAWAVVAVMEVANWTRFVWNLPLFFVALSVALGCLAGLVFAP